MNNLKKVVTNCAIISGIILTGYLGKIVHNYLSQENVQTENYVYISKPMGVFEKKSYLMIKEGNKKREIAIQENLISTKKIKFINNQFESSYDLISGLFGDSSITNKDSHRYHILNETLCFTEIKRELNKK